MEHEEKIQDIIFSFRDVNQFFYKQMWHHADELGVTLVQLQIMKVLSKKPNQGLQDITNALKIGKSTVSGTVDRLVKAGFVKREQSSVDRRSIILNLTAEGKVKKEEAHKRFYERLAGLTEIDYADIEELMRLHQLIKEKINTTGDDETC